MICRANQLTDFYVIATLVFNELMLAWLILGVLTADMELILKKILLVLITLLLA